MGTNSIVVEATWVDPVVITPVMNGVNLRSWAVCLGVGRRCGEFTFGTEDHAFVHKFSVH